MASISGADVKQIVVACEAGMGSSVMVAKMLAKQLKDRGVTVTHSPVNHLERPSMIWCSAIADCQHELNKPCQIHQ